MVNAIRKLHQNPDFMKYFKNTSWLMGERILRMTTGLFIGVWIARYLGPEQFGLLSYAQSFVFIFTAIATLGLDDIIIRELVKDESKRGVLLGTAFGLKLMGATLILPLLAITVQLTSNNQETNILVFIIASATIFQSFNVIDYYFQSKLLSKYVALANTLLLFISSLVKILLIINQAPLVAFAVMTMLDSIILSVGLIYFYLKTNRLDFLNWKFKWLTAKSLLSDSWPLILSSMVLLIQARVDQIMLKEMLGDKEVGFYSVAMRLIESVAFITIVLKSSLYPSIQQAKKNSESLYLSRLLNYYRLNFLLFIIIATPVYLFAEEIVITLFGMEYLPAGVLLSLMAIRLFFANMGVSRSAYLITENLLRFSTVTMVAGTITNIVLNYLWIEEYGAKGAIAATIISFTVTIFMVDAIYSRTRKNVLLQLRGILTFYKVNLGH